MIFQENHSREKHIDQLICSCYKKLFVLKKKRFATQKTRKHLAEALIISKIDYGNITYSNASQKSLIRLQKLLKVTCSFVNGRYSNSLDVILLGWLPISERIDFCRIELAHKALYITPFPSYLRLSFKKLSRYLRNTYEFLINNYNENSNTFTGKARTLFNNLPYQTRSISSFKGFPRGKEIFTRSDPRKIFSTSLVNRSNLICYSNFFNSSCFTSNLENFVSFS